MKIKDIFFIALLFALKLPFCIINANAAESSPTNSEPVTIIDNISDKITDIEQIREMLVNYIKKANINAQVVSNNEYPGYQPIVIEYSSPTNLSIPTNILILEYINEHNIEASNIGFVPIINGVAITTACINANKIITTTTTTSTKFITTNYGDLTNDGRITVSDAILLARIIAEDATVSITPEGMANADMNGSGTPDSDDLTLILKQIADIKN